MNELIWPKRYATVRAVVTGEPELLTVKYDDGTKTVIRSRWGCGGKGRRLVKGARIKVYQRDNVNHVNFRMVGR